jgi:S-adenosylmethionine:tRNA ribosyltransferase-isomerase
MRTDLFDFDLPPDRIALRPASPRDSARLLVVRPGHDPLLEDRIVRDLPDLLHPGDHLVVNDTKVIPAQLSGRRVGGASEPRIEATLIKRLDGSRWQALVKPARKLKPGDMVRFGEEGQGESSVCFLGQLDAVVEAKGEAGEMTFAFAFHGPVLDQAIAERGGMPLPPYIASRRTPDARDRIDYQTMFAQEEGAVAAPTAGLHFTERLTGELAARGISFHTVTLHVGAGTFLPVKVDDVAGHKMHAEWGQVSEEVAEALNAAHALGARASRPPFPGTAGVSPPPPYPPPRAGEGRVGASGRDQSRACPTLALQDVEIGNSRFRFRAPRIVAVGSTSLRLLESAAREDGAIAPFSGDTSLFITPGYRFRAVDVLLTNFHLPRSTLFMLVAAFSGLDTMKRAYAHAVEKGYRFYSYGDACLLFRNP